MNQTMRKPCGETFGSLLRQRLPSHSVSPCQHPVESRQATTVCFRAVLGRSQSYWTIAPPTVNAASRAKQSLNLNKSDRHNQDFLEITPGICLASMPNFWSSLSSSMNETNWAASRVYVQSRQSVSCIVLSPWHTAFELPLLFPSSRIGEHFRASSTHSPREDGLGSSKLRAQM